MVFHLTIFVLLDTFYRGMVN